MSSSSTANNNASLLPVPDVYTDTSSTGPVSIKTLKKWGSGSAGDDVSLHNPFFVVSKDLTDEQIDKGVYLEMLMYKTSTWLRDGKGSYTIPKSWIGWVNLRNWKESRWGNDQWYNFSTETRWNYSVDRINHLKVTSKNEKMLAWQYLNYRLTIVEVAHRDITWEHPTTIRTTSLHRAGSAPGLEFHAKGYSSEYSPTYIKFRWLMRNDEDNGFITGPCSDIVAISEKVFPYISTGFSTNWFATCKIDSSADHKKIKATINTILP